MSRKLTPLQERIAEAAKQANVSSKRKTIADRTSEIRNTFIKKNSVLTPPVGKGAFGLESILEGVVPERNKNFNVETDGDPEYLVKAFKEMGMPHRHIESVTEQVLSIFDNQYNALNIIRGDGGDVNGNYMPLASVVGRTSAGILASGGDNIATEAFGDDINRLATDDRLSMDLIIMRPWDNIMDKALARVNESSPVVTIRIPSPEAYDWAATQLPNSTFQSRYETNNYKLRNLYRNPTPVNSAPQQIIPLTANDSTGALWNSTTYYKTGQDAYVLDLARNSATFGGGVIDRTDLVSDGGIVNGVIVGITATVSSSSVTEYFLLNTAPFDNAMFVVAPTAKQSGQRLANFVATLPLGPGITQYNGNASVIAAALTDANVKIEINFNSTLNIQTGKMLGSGSVNTTLIQDTTASSISSATQTMYGTFVTSLVAYGVKLFYDEENQRKANLAIMVQYYEEQFLVPRSRVYFTEYSLTQDVDENAVATTSSIVGLGNGRRGLDIVVNSLNDISQGLAYAATYPNISSYNSISEQSFAASLVKPTVVMSDMNFATEELNVMNESTRLTEIHGRFRARILSMATILFAKSLMLNQYKPGETPVLKIWTHSTIADIVVGITDYHPDLKDKETTASGADYSMVLPNGYRLDIIKSNLDCLQQRMYVVPVIESAMDSVLSAASIRDCGTVTTNYTPTNSGAVTRRVATTTREIVMMSNKVGLMLSIEGLETQLGNYSYAQLALNSDYTESLTV